MSSRTGAGRRDWKRGSSGWQATELGWRGRSSQSAEIFASPRNRWRHRCADIVGFRRRPHQAREGSAPPDDGADGVFRAHTDEQTGSNLTARIGVRAAGKRRTRGRRRTILKDFDDDPYARKAAARFVPRPGPLGGFVARDASCEGQFYIAVQTSGAYPRPGCPARLPERTKYASSTRGTRQSGRLPPCKRCKPDQPSLGGLQAGKIAKPAG